MIMNDMIELRWLEYHSGDNNGSHPSAFSDGNRHCRVLQVRYKVGNEWGEFRDIPIVNTPTKEV